MHALVYNNVCGFVVVCVDWCGVDVNADVELESIPRQCQLPPIVQSQTQVT